MGRPQTMILTVGAMIAFAANSILCRMALGDGAIDAASFTTIRVVSGAVFLGLIILLRKRKRFEKPNGQSVLALIAYMIFFSFAYLTLSAGTGALVLFGAVQLTMFVVALQSGEHFSALSWAGLVLSFSGLVYLVSPGVTAPDPLGAVLMAIAGVAWGLYSLAGRGATNPAEATALNFIWSVPVVLLMSLVYLDHISISMRGVVLAIASGTIASGLGYTIWYAALRGLRATSAATVQLSVPVIAAIAGVVLLSEDVTLRLVLASVATLGGVAIVLLQRQHRN